MFMAGFIIGKKIGSNLNSQQSKKSKMHIDVFHGYYAWIKTMLQSKGEVEKEGVQHSYEEQRLWY